MQSAPVIPTYFEIMDERTATLVLLKEVLAEVGSDAVLVGGIAVGHHGRPRATIDVDLLVPGAKLAKLAAALEARGFVVATHADMLRIYPAGATPATAESIADLVSCDANPTLKAAFAAAEQAVVLGESIRVVQRGALVALKFHAAMSHTRRLEDRYMDVADIGRVIAKHFDAEDAAVARRIAEQMFPGAPEQLQEFIDDLRNGRPVKI